jgi:hypothetical protein
LAAKRRNTGGSRKPTGSKTPENTWNVQLKGPMKVKMLSQDSTKSEKSYKEKLGVR